MADNVPPDMNNWLLGGAGAAFMSLCGWALRKIFTNSTVIAEERAHREALAAKVSDIHTIIKKDDERQRMMDTRQAVLVADMQTIKERLHGVETTIGRCGNCRNFKD